MKDRDYTPRLSTFAKSMRRQPTDAEQRLWQVLRAGNIEGFHFRRQHPVGGYILDFYCSVLRLAIEADGGQHYMPDGKQRDSERDASLADAGILMLRFSDYDILKHSGGVAETVYARCVARAVELGRPLRGARPRARAKATPSLTLPQGGGDKRDAGAEAGEQRGPGAPTVFSSFPPNDAHSSSSLSEEAPSSSSPLGEAGRGLGSQANTSTKDFQE